MTDTDNIITINANQLTALNSLGLGHSVICVDRATNSGVIIDYSKLADEIIKKLTSDTCTSDCAKVVIVE